MTIPYPLAIVATHPIQYHSEWYRALAAHPSLDLHVYYCHRATPQEQAQAGFGVEFDWDVPLLSGYPHTFLKNIAAPPHLGRFGGLDTPEIVDIIRSPRHDAVLVNGWHYKSAWLAMRACWKSQVKVMARSDSHLHTPRSTVTRLLKAMTYPRFIRRLDACLAVGKWSREYFLRYGAKEDRIFWVPHAVDNHAFTKHSEQLSPTRSELRKQFSLSEDAVVFGFAGKFIEKKRPVDFVHAVHQAMQQGQRVQGLMIGDGPLRVDCERIVREREIPVRFAGFLNQSEIVKGYVCCDAVVLPSDGGETWGLVVNEAMACGLACIVSDKVGCGPDLIIPEETGAIFPLGDVAALAKEMLRFANPHTRHEMGAAAQRKIQEYSISAAVEGTLQSLVAILDRNADSH